LRGLDVLPINRGMKVIVTRPSPDAEAFAAEVLKIGAEPILSPVMVIRQRPHAVDLAGVAGLAFTSANGVRAFSMLTTERRLPVFAVGAATADAAAEAGFANIVTAKGDVMSLSRLIAQAKPSGAVLHLAGSDRAGDLVTMLADYGVAARRAVIYDAEKYDRLSTAAAAALRQKEHQAAVALFSPRSARLFIEQAAHEGLVGDLERAIALCLSADVARGAAAANWAAIETARMPTSDDVLSLIAGRIGRI
jgi:uroporphyrinogen-III synthase